MCQRVSLKRTDELHILFFGKGGSTFVALLSRVSSAKPRYFRADRRYQTFTELGGFQPVGLDNRFLTELNIVYSESILRVAVCIPIYPVVSRFNPRNLRIKFASPKWQWRYLYSVSVSDVEPSGYVYGESPGSLPRVRCGTATVSPASVLQSPDRSKIPPPSLRDSNRNLFFHSKFRSSRDFPSS